MITTKVKITDQDNGWNRVKAVIAQSKLYNVNVGIQEDKGQEAKIVRTKDGIKTQDITLAAVALMHEFGNGVPERSWLRAWFDANEEEVKSLIFGLGAQILEGQITQEQALHFLGVSFREGIKQRIRANIPPALAASTVKKKGHDVALIDTEQLINAIDYEIAE